MKVPRREIMRHSGAIFCQGIKHFEALCKALAKQVCDNKTKKNTTGKSKKACNNAVAAADSQEDEPLEED